MSLSVIDAVASGVVIIAPCDGFEIVAVRFSVLSRNASSSMDTEKLPLSLPLGTEMIPSAKAT